MYRCVFTVAVYLLWKERNARRMTGVKSGLEELVYQGKVLMALCRQKEKRIGRILDRSILGCKQWCGVICILSNW